MDTESTNQPAVLVARCDNYREDVDQACHGEIRFRWGMSQSDPCDVCGSRCGVAVAAWERVEPAAAVPDTGQADEVLKLRWEVQQLQGVVQDQHRAIAAVRSLCADAMKLPTLEDPRPADDRVSPRAVLVALDRAGPPPDTVQAPDVADLAYARSEVDKWLADRDPYCILPTRTEHIPALLARLDELEGTS